ncbi:MAG: hypothetical protein ACOC33_02730 [bacterium]
MKKFLNWLGNGLKFFWASFPKVWAIIIAIALIGGLVTFFIAGLDIAMNVIFFSILGMGIFFIGYVHLRQLWWWITSTGDYEENKDKRR